MRRPIDETYAYADIDSFDLPPGKRRKTILDAFSNITISQGDSLASNTGGSSRSSISSDLNAESCYSLPLPNEFMIDAEDDDDVENDIPLSDKALLERERNIMRSLVFGGPPRSYYLQIPQQDPVEQRISNLIRGSIQEAIRQEPPSQSQSKPSCGCDMDVETSYSRPSVGLSDEERRPRSNSLPKEWQTSSDDESMDID